MTSSMPTSRAGCRIPTNHAQLVADWRAVETAARAADPRITGPTGYAGFSMGAMFGLSIVADLASVSAAVFALGGLMRDDDARRADPFRCEPTRRA